MNTKAARQQYASLSRDIKSARTAGHWGLAKNLEKKQTALKPYLVQSVDNNSAPATPWEPQHIGNTSAPTKTSLCVASARVMAFNFYCVPGSQNTRHLTDKVFTLWTEHHTFQRMISPERMQVYRTIVDGVICNVLYAQISQHEGVRLSRDTAFLSIDSRYRPNTFNRRLLTVLDDLHNMGIIEQIRGERWGKNYAKTFGFGGNSHRPTTKQTELHTTDTLKELCTAYRVSALEDFTFQTDRQEVVILKRDKSSALVEYEDTPKIIKYRMQVKRINRMLEKAGDLIAPEAKRFTKHDQRQRFLVRKFTYNSLESGGRLWGGFWQGMRRVERPHVLRINGEKTVEIDYKAVMVHIAYIVTDEPTPEMEDLYAIPGLSPASRPGIKKFMSAMLFKESLPTKFPKGVSELLAPEDQAKGCAYVLRQIQTAHEGINHLFGTGIGHYLQYLESRLMVNILLYSSVMGITALPIHDCLIVAKSQRGRTRGIMDLMSKKVLGRGIPSEVKEDGKEEMEWLEGQDEG